MGLTFFGGPLVHALRRAVDDLVELAVGEDPMNPEAVWGKLMDACSSAGPEGILSLGLAPIDMAVWDIKGKALDQTVCGLMGRVSGSRSHLRQRRADAAHGPGVPGRSRPRAWWSRGSAR